MMRDSRHTYRKLSRPAKFSDDTSNILQTDDKNRQDVEKGWEKRSTAKGHRSQYDQTRLENYGIVRYRTRFKHILFVCQPTVLRYLSYAEAYFQPMLSADTDPLEVPMRFQLAESNGARAASS